MKYFVLENNEKNIMPRVINWYQKINPRYLCVEKYDRLPQKVILDMKLGKGYVYTDIITNPFFMVSEEAWQVIYMYDKDIPVISAILLDVDNRGQAIYYIPVLPKVKSLSKEDIRNLVVFKLEDAVGSKIFIRLDLAESLLQRDAVGICLKEAFVLE